MTDDFILHGSTLAMKESQIPEHPGWEDLIEIKNIEKEIEEIESDIRFLQKSSENRQK